MADTFNEAIRLIKGTNFAVSTIAGVLDNTGRGDGIGSYARFGYVTGIAVDAFNNIIVADYSNHEIRLITTPTYVVMAISGGLDGSANGIGTNARYRLLGGVAADSNGNLFAADYKNNTIFKLQILYPTSSPSRQPSAQPATVPSGYVYMYAFLMFDLSICRVMSQ